MIGKKTNFAFLLFDRQYHSTVPVNFCFCACSNWLQKSFSSNEDTLNFQKLANLILDFAKLK